jgi:hypothetical protein
MHRKWDYWGCGRESELDSFISAIPIFRPWILSIMHRLEESKVKE